MFLGKGILKIGSKFTEEHPCSDFNKVAFNFIEISLLHGCSPVNLLYKSRINVIFTIIVLPLTWSSVIWLFITFALNAEWQLQNIKTFSKYFFYDYVSVAIFRENPYRNKCFFLVINIFLKNITGLILLINSTSMIQKQLPGGVPLKIFLKMLQTSLENTCVRLQHRCFPAIFLWKFIRTSPGDCFWFCFCFWSIVQEIYYQFETAAIYYVTLSCLKIKMSLYPP